MTKLKGIKVTLLYHNTQTRRTKSKNWINTTRIWLQDRCRCHGWTEILAGIPRQTNAF